MVGESGCGKSTLATGGAAPAPGDGDRGGGGAAWRAQDVYAMGDRRGARDAGPAGRAGGAGPHEELQPGDAGGGAHPGGASAARPPASGQDLWPWVMGLLDALRIPQPARRARQYPARVERGHAAAGGHRRRVGQLPAPAARGRADGLAGRHLAVDVVRACASASRREGAAMLLITHQLGLAAQVADRVAVMYAGRVVELGPARRVLVRPPPSLHARPPGGDAPPRGRAPGAPGGGAAAPWPRRPPGCAFSARCPLALPQAASGRGPGADGRGGLPRGRRDRRDRRDHEGGPGRSTGPAGAVAVRRAGTAVAASAVT